MQCEEDGSYAIFDCSYHILSKSAPNVNRRNDDNGFQIISKSAPNVNRVNDDTSSEHDEEDGECVPEGENANALDEVGNTNSFVSEEFTIVQTFSSENMSDDRTNDIDLCRQRLFAELVSKHGPTNNISGGFRRPSVDSDDFFLDRLFHNGDDDDGGGDDDETVKTSYPHYAISTEEYILAKFLGLDMEYDLEEDLRSLIRCGSCYSMRDELRQENIEYKLRSCCRDGMELHGHLPTPFEGIICDSCLKEYIITKINLGIPFIKCPGASHCETFLSETEIKEHISDEQFEKYQKILLNIRGDPYKKTCPNCCLVYTASHKNERQVCCTSCSLMWCFHCYAPWHEGITCKKYQKGNHSLKIWAKNKGKLVKNAQRCPSCKIFIQKDGGCDHMHCTKCRTDFCYRCGGRFINLRFLGNHHSKYSVLGCKYEFKPSNPVQRIVTRGAVLTGQMVLLPAAAGVLVGVGCMAVAGVIAASPVLIPYKIVKRHKKLRKEKKLEEIFNIDNSFEHD